MALVIAVLAGVAIGAVIASKTKVNAATITQNIMNSIDVSAVSNILIQNQNITQLSATSFQNIKLGLDHCTFPQDGSIDIDQIYSGQFNLIGQTDTTIDSNTLSTLQSKINDQLTAAITQENDKLVGALSGGQTADMTSDVTNKLNSSVTSNVTQTTIQKIQASVFNVQSTEVNCSYSTLPATFKIDQNAVVNMTIQNLIGNSLTSFVSDSTVTDWATTEADKADQKATNPLLSFLSDLGTAWLIIIGVIAFVVIAIIMVVIIRALKSPSRPPSEIPSRPPSASIPPSALRPPSA